MNEIIYIVMEGYRIGCHVAAVFKDKEEAEFYCTCHRDCEVWEYEFSDGKIFTPFNAVKILFEICPDDDGEIDFQYVKCAKEDERYFNENRNKVLVYDYDSAKIMLARILPDNYDEEEIEQKYTKICKDLKVKILQLMSKFDCSTYESREVVDKKIEQYIADRFEMDEENE